MIRLERPSSNASSEPWTLAADRTLDGEPSRRSEIAVSGDRVLVARNEEPLVVLSVDSFEPLCDPVPLPGSLVPVGAAPLDDEGRFLVITSDGRCHLFEPSDSNGSTYALSKTLRTREVETVQLHPTTGDLYVAHHIDQIDVVSAEDLSVKQTIRPSLARWRMVDYYGISPLRMIIPQTGELGETIASIVSGKSAIAFTNPNGEEELVRYHILRPVLSCTLFIFVMLSISCVYFVTRDF